jgi:hypothetical protein
MDADGDDDPVVQELDVVLHHDMEGQLCVNPPRQCRASTYPAGFPPFFRALPVSTH